MGKPEKIVEDALVSFCKSRGGISRKVKCTGHKGFPDRFCALPTGFFFLAEVKREKGGRYEKLQEHEIELLRALGIRTYKIDRVKDLQFINAQYKRHLEENW